MECQCVEGCRAQATLRRRRHLHTQSRLLSNERRLSPRFQVTALGNAIDVAPLMPAGRNYSRINQGRPELIDHILASELLVKKVDVNSVGVVIAEPLPSISPVPTARLNEASSDHAPVAATFLI